MRTLRRYLAVAALMFWLGGFTFYVSVVVPVGTEVLGSALRQGFITRRVTVWLNVAAAVSLAALALDTLAGPDLSRWRFRTRLALWAGMAVCQIGLFYLHADMDRFLQAKGAIVLNSEAFYWRHRVYLWLHTAQWVMGLGYIALMLKAWQREDESQARQQAGLPTP